MYLLLRLKILRLELKPGQRIRMDEFCRRLQVSRTPVREALLLLAHENLIDLVPQKYTTVSLLCPSRFPDEIFLLESLVCDAVWSIKAKQNDIDVLKQDLRAQQTDLGNKDYFQFVMDYKTFFSYIFHVIGKEYIWEDGQRHCGHILRLMYANLQRKPMAQEAYQNNLQILQQIELENKIKALAVAREFLHGDLVDFSWLQNVNSDFFC